MNDTLSRKPLSETVKKYGSSKMFLAAIILGLVGIGLGLLSDFVEFPRMFDEMLAELEMDYAAFAEAQAVLMFLYGFIIIIMLAATVPSVLMYVGLLRGYNYFSGKTANAGGFNFYLKVYKVMLIVIGSIGATPIAISVFGILFSIPIGAMSWAEIVALLFFVIPLIVAICGGAAVLIIFTYKATKKTMDHAMCAAVDIYCGEVSIFLIVMTIIGIVNSASAILELPLSFSVTSFNGAPYTASALSAILGIPQLISQIFFVILMFKFKAEIKSANNEWNWIQGQIAANQAARAQEETATRAQSEALGEASKQTVEGVTPQEFAEEAANEPLERADGKAPTESDDDNGNGDTDIFVN